MDLRAAFRCIVESPQLRPWPNMSPGLHLLGIINVCTKFHADPSRSCKDITVSLIFSVTSRGRFKPPHVHNHAIQNWTITNYCLHQTATQTNGSVVKKTNSINKNFLCIKYVSRSDVYFLCPWPDHDKTVQLNFALSRLFLLIYGFYLSVTQQRSRKYFHCSVAPQGFYIHQFQAAPNIQSVLNPQVNPEMSHNLLLLQYYQSKSRRVQAVYRHFLLSIPTFLFYSCPLQGCLSGDDPPGISFCPEETATRGSAAQLTHKRLKIWFSALL